MTCAVIFDLDGTLIDSAPDIHAAANQVMVNLGLSAFTLEEARSFVGHGAPIFIDRCLTARGHADAPELNARALKEFLDIYEDAVELTQPYAGVPECLDVLQQMDARLGVCTNKPEAPARSVLLHLDMQDYFSVVIGGDTADVRKPDPKPLLMAMKALGAEKVIFVGDSEVDSETAQRANVPFALYTEGYRKTSVAELYHTVTFERFVDLPALVRDLSS